MTSVSANLIRFHSKLVEFRITEKYTDVTIECENESFKCHRVTLASASEYFDAMFGGGFKESADASVVLKKMNAEIFKEVIRFIYTGEVVIDSSNIYGLLQASDFLKINVVQDLCVRYIRENKMSVENTFDVFTLACATKMESLISLLTRDITEQFRIFCRSNKFLEISFDDLSVILDAWRTSHMLLLERENEELFFGATIRWIFHSRESRLQYTEKLLRNFRFENLISDEYTRFVFVKLLTNPNAADLTQIIKPVGFDEVPEMTRKTAILKNTKHLNVYIQCSEENTVRVFSIRDKDHCFVSGEINNILGNRQLSIRSVALDDDHLYCVHYPRQYSEYVDTHDERNQKFCVYNSVDLCSALELKNPPFVFKDLSLCALQNNIYACSGSQFHYRSSSAVFNGEKIKYGAHVYNCDLDEWYSMPAMEKPFYTCCATTCNRMLYLFGSEFPYDEPGTSNNSIQIRAYDYRLDSWLNLTSHDIKHSIWTDCCKSRDQNKILLHSGPQTATTYDIKAKRWEEMDEFNFFMLDETKQYRRFISFSNQIWAIGNCIEDKPSDLPVQVFTYSDTWYPGQEDQLSFNSCQFSSLLTNTAKNSIDKTTGIVLDAVVFRSPT